jgi:hypothetical protein
MSCTSLPRSSYRGRKIDKRCFARASRSQSHLLELQPSTEERFQQQCLNCGLVSGAVIPCNNSSRSIANPALLYGVQMSAVRCYADRVQHLRLAREVQAGHPKVATAQKLLKASTFLPYMRTIISSTTQDHDAAREYAYHPPSWWQ